MKESAIHISLRGNRTFKKVILRSAYCKTSFAREWEVSRCTAVVVKGGQIVSGSYGSFRADLAIKGEKIAAIGDGLDGKYVINASGKLVMPGVIDAHVHMELPVSGTRSSDDFSSGTKAAACGGVTTIIDFTVGSSESTIPEDIEKDSRRPKNLT